MGEEKGFIRNEGSAFATRLGKNYANGPRRSLKTGLTLTFTFTRIHFK
jgi:hypothetical protein